MARYITYAMLHMIVRLSRKGRTKFEIVAITAISQGTVSNILKRSRETGNLTQDLAEIAKDGKLLENTKFYS